VYDIIKITPVPIHDSANVFTLQLHYPSIYIILRFPIVAYPVYDIIKITPVPIHDSANVFTLIKTTYNLIDKETVVISC